MNTPISGPIPGIRNLQGLGSSLAEVYLLQMVNSGEILLAESATLSHANRYHLKKPLRLMVQQSPAGVQIGLAPMLPFLPKSLQQFDQLDIAADHVLFCVPLSQAISDGGKLLKRYHEEVSGIQLV